MSTLTARAGPALIEYDAVEMIRPRERIARQTHLYEVIEHAAHLLPAQGPITVFIHHNTLHAFEDLPFEEAVKKGARIFGCQPYMSEDQYREALGRGRIRFSELQDVLTEEMGTAAQVRIPPGCTRLELCLAMLQYPLRFGPTEELRWFVAETDALRRFRAATSLAVRQRSIAETRRWVMRDLRRPVRAGSVSDGPGCSAAHASGSDAASARQRLARVLARFNEEAIESWSDATWEAFTLQALWRLCCDGVNDLPTFTIPTPTPIRHRDLLLAVTGVDTDLLVNEVLIRFCASFLDQGFARWRMPARDDGFYLAFANLYGQPAGPHLRWMHGLPAELRRVLKEHVNPLASVDESLRALGVRDDELDAFIGSTLLSLRGWAGMIAQIEDREDRVVHPVRPGSWIEFVAVRLLLDRWATVHVARTALGFDGPLHEVREAAWRRVDAPKPPSVEQRAFLVFELAQVLAWTPEELSRLSRSEWETLLKEIETFNRLERRRIFHLAYERRFYTQTLDAVALHAPDPAPTPAQPRFQAMFCIDEREESLRRHVEELAPDAETFSIAGFYFVPMYYRSVADAHFVPLCPAVMRPKHWVAEQVAESPEEHERQTRSRRVVGMASHQFHVGSRNFALGALLSGAVGVLATAPMIARTFFPRLTAQLRRRVGGLLWSPRRTRLQLERSEDPPGTESGRLGFTLDEMTNIAERVLRDIGMTARFSRWVLTIGHGSTSMNNPHESAHDCGACGGARGGPNGRAISQILNDPRIRRRLQERGLAIPDDTMFIGGMHNTSSETVTFYDLDQIPEERRADFAKVRALMEEAADRDAHERTRRFESAPLTHSFTAARQHVEGRAEDLAQVRPEWGHATNAISICGRRAWTRGLFLDRRAFLTSYDPTQDDADSTILTRVLQAIFPVCAGINLEYYFSFVDNTGWGSGTKLPHNISALLGVMDGAASDLRTGLPWQMVEIHEPVRLLNIIETSPEAMLRILDRNAGLHRLCRNGWVHLSVIHPDTRKICVYRKGRFEDYVPQSQALARAATSVDWYRGWRDHLEFAKITGEIRSGAW